MRKSKFFVIALAVVMAVAMMPLAVFAEVKPGGWSYEQTTTDPKLPEEVATAYSDALSKIGYGSTIEPVAYYSKQVVNGVNYAFICKSSPVVPDPEPYLFVLTIHQSLDGTAEYMHMESFDLDFFIENMSPVIPDVQSGSWEYAEDHSTATLPDAAMSALDRATAETVGVALEPIALLGTQVVNGTNYAFLCHTRLLDAALTERIDVVFVNDSQGKAQVKGFYTLNPNPEDIYSRPEPPAGPWDYSQASTAPSLPQEVATAFSEAMEDVWVGANVLPVAYYSKQIVNGTNYAIICQDTPSSLSAEPYLLVLLIYKGINEKAKLVGNPINLDIGACFGKIPPVISDAEDGAWQYAEDYSKAELPADVQSYLENATSWLFGVSYDPIALLGTQAVNGTNSGTNYAILCHTKLTDVALSESVKIAFLNVNADGNVMFLGTYTMNPDPNRIMPEPEPTPAKKANPTKVTGRTIKASAAKNKTFTAKQAFKVTKPTGKITYKQVTKNSRIKVASNGKVTVKKGLKKGKTYKITVKYKVAATEKYKASKEKKTVLKVKIGK